MLSSCSLFLASLLLDRGSSTDHNTYQKIPVIFPFLSFVAFIVALEKRNTLKCNLMLQVLVPTTITVSQKPMLPKKELGSIRAKDTEDNGGPTTTVFVGNISEKASDMLVRQLLAVSGLSALTGLVK